MSTTFKGDGLRIPYSNSGSAINSSAVVVLRSGSNGRIGIAVANIAATTGTGVLEVGPGRLHTLAKKVGDVFAYGTILYWDTVNMWLTTTFTAAFTRAGTSDGVYASAATTAGVAINT